MNFFFLYYLKNRLTGQLKKRYRIVFYPESPHHRSVVYQICRHLGVRMIENNGKKYDLAFLWQDQTVINNISKPILKTAINANCVDISKTKVACVFENVFGYSYHVDPLVFKGKCVEKSNDNAKHDGHLVTCPKSPEPGKVYQKLINNRVSDTLVCDIRVPVIGNHIPLIYHKYKYLHKRFSNDTCQVKCVDPDKSLNKQNIENILKFCGQIGLDYGELDILQDQNDGLIYIVDVNKTPWGPPRGLNLEDQKKALSLMLESFETEFLNNCYSTPEIMVFI